MLAIGSLFAQSLHGSHPPLATLLEAWEQRKDDEIRQQEFINGVHFLGLKLPELSLAAAFKTLDRGRRGGIKCAELLSAIERRRATIAATRVARGDLVVAVAPQPPQLAQMSQTLSEPSGRPQQLTLASSSASSPQQLTVVGSSSASSSGYAETKLDTPHQPVKAEAPLKPAETPLERANERRGPATQQKHCCWPCCCLPPFCGGCSCCCCCDDDEEPGDYEYRPFD